MQFKPNPFTQSIQLQHATLHAAMQQTLKSRESSSL